MLFRDAKPTACEQLADSFLSGLYGSEDTNPPINLPTLAEFVQVSWDELEPSTKLEWNWHMGAICDHVEAVLMDWLRRKKNPGHIQLCQNLLVNVPPGSAKSRIVSVCTPAWFWLHEPSWRAIFISANPRVALRDSVLCRDLIESKWYQETFHPTWVLRADNNAKGSYWNTAGGVRSAFGFGSKITGDRGDAIFIDDPHDAEEVRSDAKRLMVIERWVNAIANRVNDLRSSVRIGIMQRLHELDWGGQVLENESWERLCIRQEFEPGLPPTFLGWKDPRGKIGELMFPERFPQEIVDGEKSRLGARGYAAQHQQNPAPTGGGMFSIRKWRLAIAPPKIDRTVISVDASFKGGIKNDFVVVGAVSQRIAARWSRGVGKVDRLTGVQSVIDVPEHQYWVPYRWRKKAGYSETEKAVVDTCSKFPFASAKLIEDKANGSTLVERLSRTIADIEPINPGSDSKVARAMAIAPIQERGDIILPASEEIAEVLQQMGVDSITVGEWWDLNPPPHQSNAEYVPAPQWVKDFIDEFAVFPSGAHDDQVDFLDQAINWYESNTKVSKQGRSTAITKPMSANRKPVANRRR